MLILENTRRNRCPVCDKSIYRSRRTDEDRKSRYGPMLYRYTCNACKWSGLLPKQPSRQRKGPMKRIISFLVLCIPYVVAAIVGALAVIAVAAYNYKSISISSPVPGEHFEGIAINRQHPVIKLKTVIDDPLVIKQYCLWGKPGNNPYKGTVRQALQTARLPAEVIDKIEVKVNNNSSDSRLIIFNNGIRTVSDNRVFDSRNIALTFAKSICVNSKVNFPNGHTEGANLYEATGNNGLLYSVMIPDVCGNVSVLSEQGSKAILPVLHNAEENGKIHVLGINDEVVFAGFSSMATVNEVPEAPSVFYILLGVGLMFLFRNK